MEPRWPALAVSGLVTRVSEESPLLFLVHGTARLASRLMQGGDGGKVWLALDWPLPQAGYLDGPTPRDGPDLTDQLLCS